ncbi:hypothetical protein [Actinokineospora globicatena]|uniref:hypothetical protein n=1 Tax=Actinokineospora globicatena TaxID=103729 RepID=UPI0020A26C5C|nr:hypothetical protein [Actinokineospora globicatena]MCP2306855.1 hypothetical protein [Actinokineospora globicatena]GLW82296.1 hypothetical protein Aglo01_67770 [Actinokineospora globicatena]GLW89111.1 hypothetical protein Aglo02_67500 [Actinokineospora globicatena]
MDPEVHNSLTRILGHAAPYEWAEVDRVDSVLVRFAKSVDGLSDLPRLGALVLSAPDVTAIPDLADLPLLSILEVSDSDVTDVRALTTATRLRDVSLLRNKITDLVPVLDCARLESLDVTGNPLSEDSYRRVLAELRDRGVRVVASQEREWRLTLALHAAGLPFSYYLGGDDRHLLSRPGVTRSPYPHVGHINVPPDELEHLLDHDPAGIEPLFDDPDRVLWHL